LGINFSIFVENLQMAKKEMKIEGTAVLVDVEDSSRSYRFREPQPPANRFDAFSISPTAG
jgi:hypothetical protein